MSTAAVALGLEVGTDDLRVIQLDRSGETAEVTGFAAVTRPPRGRLADGARKLIDALEPSPEVGVTIAHHDADDGEIAAVVGALRDAGHADVTSIPFATAVHRAAGPDEIALTDGFRDCPIPPGLLNAHASLRVEQLAAAVGAALDRLDLGHLGEASVAHDEPVVESPASLGATPVDGSATARLAATIAAERQVATADAGSVADDAAAGTRLDPADEGPAAVRPLVVLIAFALVVGLGLLGWLVFGTTGTDEPAETSTAANTNASIDDSAVTSGEDTETSDAEQGDQGNGLAASSQETGGQGSGTAAATSVPDPDPDPAPDPTAAPTSTPDPLEDLPPLSELPERGAVFVAEEQTLYLRGPVTAEEGALLEARAIEVLGADRVVNEYLYRPDAPPVTEGTVRVEQAVLFESGSAVIAESFVPTLELGLLVMVLNPQVTMVVEGHTDDVGSAEANQALSEARADAVVDYLVANGLDRERLVSVGRGESEPIADNETEEGRRLNRRIEVDLVDLISARPADTGD